MTNKYDKAKYNSEFDSFYNPELDEWIEPKCDDPHCWACKDRPAKPSEAEGDHEQD